MPAKGPIKLGVSKPAPRSATMMMPNIRTDGRNLDHFYGGLVSGL